ncbi:LytR/AlgR family response regulator transcription factor [Hymenobacter volaticus]|uniref:LytTR family DNA-binding domain-containing protein n=1 Tax=Hymenobacter volaticus TaxID=2932254 RepID=A0ABY4GDU8_9BACT|nr:LytTR family DNA-binding domain-containing protein [Hymenobacter volaticus]UOQ68960.1 LytTR family DNA-binding domain-containing protein [Hymenobacter volaticus]
MLHAIAIDDEPAALEVLQRYAAKVPFLQLTHSFLSTTEALACLHTERVDLLFLDIQMPDVLGLDFARLLAPLQKPIVFTTAYAEHAVEGFSLQALDYLLKPIEFGRFLQACNRAYTQVMPAREGAPGIFVKDGYDWIRVNVEQVFYIQSDTNLLFIHEQDRLVTTRMTLADMLATLPAEEFIRVHKSYIVALKAIRKIERHQVTVGTVSIPLAESYRESLQNRLLKRNAR